MGCFLMASAQGQISSRILIRLCMTQFASSYYLIISTAVRKIMEQTDFVKGIA